VVDPQMKWQLRASLRDVHRHSRATMIYVTHDQTEALTFADKVVVMYAGEIVQVGTPAELFDKPSHTFVGYFIGSPGMNVIPVTVEGASAKIGAHAVSLDSTPALKGGQRLELGVRPEHVKLGAQGIPADLTRVEDGGRYRIAHLSMGGHSVAALLRDGEEIPAKPMVAFDPVGVHLYADSWRVETGVAR
jgi:glycerol transport system ATP-binding protein